MFVPGKVSPLSESYRRLLRKIFPCQLGIKKSEPARLLLPYTCISFPLDPRNGFSRETREEKSWQNFSPIRGYVMQTSPR